MLTVIDTSRWDGIIDWPAVKASGLVAGAIHKCTEGTSYVDPQYHNNAKGTIAQCVPWSAYHFHRPGYDALKQAKWAITNLGDTPPKLLWDDVETALAAALAIPKGASAEEWLEAVATVKMKTSGLVASCGGYVAEAAIQAADYLDAGTILTDTITICDYWTSQGFKAGIYSSPGFIKAWLSGAGSEKLAKYLLWIANTEVTAPFIPYPWSAYGAWPSNHACPLWQYAWNGSIPGINAAVDMNHFSGSEEDLRILFGNGEIPAPVPEPDIPDVVRVKVDKLNVRAGPGTGYGVIGTVPRGFTLFVTDKKTYTATNYWYECGAGWVAGWLCEVV